MKHLILLFAFAVVAYFGWQYAKKRDKRTVTRFTRRHAAAVLAILAALYLLVSTAFYNRSINII